MDIKDIPGEVWYIEICRQNGIPIGYKLWDETVKKYPEHFPEETKRRELWESIPQKIKDKFDKAMSEMYQEVYGRAQHKLNLGKGIMHRINNPKEYIEYDKEQERLSKIYRIKEAKLHKKYYGKYGYKKL